MIYRMSKPARQLLALFLVFAVLGAATLAIGAPVMAYLDHIQESIDEESDSIAKLREVVNKYASEVADDHKKLLTDSGLFIQGSSDSIRLAALQSLVSQALAENGVKQRSLKA